MWFGTDILNGRVLLHRSRQLINSKRRGSKTCGNQNRSDERRRAEIMLDDVEAGLGGFIAALPYSGK